MAGDAVAELLAKLTLVPGDWSSVTDQLKAQMQSISAQSATAHKEDQANAAATLAVLKEQQKIKEHLTSAHGADTTGVEKTTAAYKEQEKALGSLLSQLQHLQTLQNKAVQAHLSSSVTSGLQDHITQLRNEVSRRFGPTETVASRGSSGILQEMRNMLGGFVQTVTGREPRFSMTSPQSGGQQGMLGSMGRMFAPLGTTNLQGGAQERESQMKYAMQSGTLIGQARTMETQSRPEKETMSREKEAGAPEEEQRRPREREEESEGGFGRIREAGIAGLFGGGMTGNILQGIAGGAAGAAVFGGITEGLEKLLEKMKEFIEDSGSLQKVLDTFQRLSAGQGIDSTQYLDQLFDATHHLVNETDLLRVANTQMQSGLKISKDDTLALMKAVVGLARVQGHDAPEAVEALNQAFLTGRAWSLARFTGIQRQQMQVRGEAPEMSQGQRLQTEFDYTKQSILQRYQQIGEPALTYTDRLKQMQVASTDLFENMAQGVVKSGGFGQFMQQLGAAIDKSGGLEEAFDKLGGKIGDVFGTLTTAADGLKTFVGDLVSLGKAFDSSSTGADALKSGAAGIVDSMAPLQRMGLALAITFIDLGAAIKDDVLALAGLAKASADFDRKEAGTGQRISSDFNEGVSQIRGGKTSQGLHTMLVGGGKADQNVPSPENDFKAMLAAMQKNEDAATDKVNSLYDGILRSNSITKASAALNSNKQLNTQYQALLSKYGSTVHIPDAQKFAFNKNVKAAVDSYVKTTGNGLEPADYNEVIGQVQEHFAGPVKLDVPDPGLDRRNKMELAQAQSKDKIAAAQEALEKQKEIIAQEQEAWDAMYKNGTKSAQAYYAEKDSLAKKTQTATIVDIMAEAQAQRDLLEATHSAGERYTPAYEEGMKSIDRDAARKITAANAEQEKQQASDSLSMQQDIIQAKIAGLHSVLNTTKETIQQETELNQKMFSASDISAKQYLSNRIDYLQQEAAATTDTYKQIAELQVKNPAEQTKTYAAALEAIKQYQSQLQMLGQHPETVAAQDVNKQYGVQQEGLKNSLSLFNSPGGSQLFAKGTTEGTFYTQMAQVTANQITQLQQLLALAPQYSQSWQNIFNSILQATSQLDTFTQQAKQSDSVFANVGSLLGTGASQFQNIATGSFAQGFEKSISGAAGVLQQVPTWQTQFATMFGEPSKKTTPKLSPEAQEMADNTKAAGSSMSNASEDLGQFGDHISTVNDSFASLVNQITTAIASLQTFSDTLSGKTSTSGPPPPSMMDLSAYAGGEYGNGMGLLNGIGGNQSAAKEGGNNSMFSSIQMFSKSIGQFVQSIGSFISTISSSTSPLGGAVAGGAGGAGLGSAVGGSIKALGSAGGPIGAAVGGIAGLLSGMLAGEKEQQIHQNIVDMQYAYLQMTEAMENQNASLNTTINALKGLIQEAQQEQASSKKGGSQYQDLINQYNQQLASLEAQAVQTMQQLQEQVDIVSEPNTYQQWVQQIESVIEQYQQFVGAASNATQLAQANEYLTDSLQNIGYQMGTTLLSDEENAIQEALQLNQLYLQRNALNQQYLEQVESIMGQGVLTRQQTTAQTKYSQLFSASADYEEQLDQINLQINLAQQQVSAAQQVFQLATNKAGLESQLLTLENQSIQMDMARISAMQNLLSVLGSSGYSITNLAALSGLSPAALLATLLADMMSLLSGSGSNSAELQQLLALLGQSGGTGASTNAAPSAAGLDTLATGAYAQRASFGYGSFTAGDM